MATLKAAIEKVGVGGKVTFPASGIQFTVTAVGKTYALLTNEDGVEDSWELAGKSWEPVLPKKRIVLQAWGCNDGAIIWIREGTDSINFMGALAKDIPDMVFEDGKQVF